VDVSRAQQKVASVPNPTLTARYQHDDSVRMDEGPWPGGAMFVTAVAAQPNRELVTLERFARL
jgi:hypothetical protein